MSSKSGRSVSAKEASVVAISAALYAVFFGLSFVVPSPSPSFVLLYLPVILLGVFPVWFGLPGLAGGIIGAVIGGIFVENLAFAAWIEGVTALVIYGLNWVLMPRSAAEGKRKSILILLGVYALTLFLGTGYILWQFTTLGLFTPEGALIVLLPTFAINYLIEALICPALLRAMSLKLRSSGVYVGNFWEWRERRRVKSEQH